MTPDAATLAIPTALRRGEWPPSSPGPDGYTERLHLTGCEPVPRPTAETLGKLVDSLRAVLSGISLTASERDIETSAARLRAEIALVQAMQRVAMDETCGGLS